MNTAPVSVPTTIPIVNTSAAFAAASACRNHANPVTTIRSPNRYSGRRWRAYSPVPMKLQPTNGPRIAQISRRW
jgi:hypothetical protein